MSRSDYTIAPIPAGTISHVKQLDKYSPTGLHFTNWLGNIYADDPENNNEPITIWFVDTPTGSQIDHDEQIAQENVEKMEINSLTNNNNIDPDNIMKMIVTTPNCGMITILSKIMTTDLPIQQKILSKQEWTPKIIPSGQQKCPPQIMASKQQEWRIKPQTEIGTDMNETEEQYKYINLQWVFGDILSNETIEEITRITSSNEQQNYWNTLDFIAYKARRDQMINDYILT